MRVEYSHTIERPRWRRQFPAVSEGGAECPPLDTGSGSRKWTCALPPLLPASWLTLSSRPCLFTEVQGFLSLNVDAILYLHSSCYINFFSFFPPFLFRFQLSNGFTHCSLSSESQVGPVGASLFPHCLPASRLLPRVTSVHLPDYAHYHTIGPGMFPSSQIPSWKVCVSPPSALLSSLSWPLCSPPVPPTSP